MLKRTTGRLLLTLLVVTGLAGTLNNGSLSQKERKQAINLIKNCKAEINSCVNHLSHNQLVYKQSAADPSIEDLLISMVANEIKCSEEIRHYMEKPSESENRLKITVTDEQLFSMNNFPPMIDKENNPALRNANDALRKFNTLRNNQIKYIRTSTEDLRNHVVSTPSGWVDCYQYNLLLADRSRLVAEKINEIKSSPGFPSK